MAEIPLFPKAILFLSLVAFLQVSFATSKPNGLSMRLIRRDSLYPGNLTTAERIKRLIQLSARAYYSDSVLSLNESADTDNIHLPTGRVPENYLYVVEFKLGSQLHPVKLIMDTGGGLIWTQCKPCKVCFPQQVPIYDSQASTSYRKLPCTHELCRGEHRRYTCNSNNECVYNIPYGVGSSPRSARTKGVASFESFQFPVDNVHTRVIDDMIFGCSNENYNFGFSNSQISGILGLNLAPDALASQLAKKGIISYQFSYCLVPFDDELVRRSVLRFGDDIPRPVGNLQTTDFLMKPGRYHYHLELLDISVGFHRLGFQQQPDIFKVRSDGTGGCVVDSGTLLTNIDQKTIGRNAFKEVVAVFQAYYDSRNFRRKREVEKSLGLPVCYRIRPGFKDFVTMTLHFNGADYDIDGKYTHFFDKEEGYFCVALKPSSKTILGSWQQQNMRLIYNMNVGALQWVTETCANDHIP